MTDKEIKEINSSFRKFLIILALGLGSFLLALLFSRCDSEPAYYINTEVKWKGGDTSTLWVKKGAGAWEQQANGEFHHVTFDCYENDLEVPMYQLEYAGRYEFHFLYFTGFNNYVKDKNGNLVKDTSLELPLDYKTSNSFKSTGPLLEQDEYHITLGYSKIE